MKPAKQIYWASDRTPRIWAPYPRASLAKIIRRARAEPLTDVRRDGDAILISSVFFEADASPSYIVLAITEAAQ